MGRLPQVETQMDLPTCPAYRGRCQKPVFRSVQPAPLPKFANNRTYDPLVKVVSYTAVHRTRQVRRLYAFKKTLTVRSLAFHTGSKGLSARFPILVPAIDRSMVYRLHSTICNSLD